MTRLKWSEPKDRQFETGVDRAVLILNDGTIVPWNGLIGVEEKGGEGVTTFYHEGRPTLHLPKIKEFGATISAYTYPEEFSKILGVAEGSEGVYLDSQPSETFSLCYRTLVGDGLNGQDSHYKVHLIYNVSVVPSQASYSTLSSSIEPVEFAWEIFATPIRLAPPYDPPINTLVASFSSGMGEGNSPENYRPTAHFILDSRRIDPVRLRDLESFLYGNYERDPKFLPPEVLFLPSVPHGLRNGGTPWTTSTSLVDGLHPSTEDQHDMVLDPLNPSEFGTIDGGQHPDVWFATGDHLDDEYHVQPW